MFELVVAICIIVILYTVAFNRMDGLPAAAERAAFISSLSHIKSGVRLHMVNRLTSGRQAELMEQTGSNPMDLLLEVPGNYRGEVPTVDAALADSSWYFEAATGDLVYVVGDGNIGNVLVRNGNDIAPQHQIRFQLRNIEEEGGWQALMLVPRRPYEWGSWSVEQQSRQLSKNGDNEPEREVRPD